MVGSDDKLYLLPVGGSGGNWYKNVRQAGTIRVAAGDAEHTASATMITTPPVSRRWSRPSAPSTRAET
jgi:hypothetical protein